MTTPAVKAAAATINICLFMDLFSIVPLRLRLLRLQVGWLVHLENAAKANGCQGTGQSRAPPPRHAMLLLCLVRVLRAASCLCCGTIFQRQTRARLVSSRIASA